MSADRSSARWLLLALTAATLAGCGDSGDGPAPAGQSQAPLPPPPVWSRSLIGKRLTEFPASNQCLGAFDRVATRHTDASPGVEVEGWAWLKAEKQPPEHLLFVDPGGGVVGAGETTTDRPDVSKAIPEVTAQKVGWRGVVSASAGSIRAFAALPNGALCPIGAKDIGP
jgi:hypothetical protein